MKTIKIAHLYYDLLNLYGENGNIRYLKKQLEEQDCKVTVHFLTIDDNINFDDYDIFYIGTGSEKNQEIVLEDIIKYKEKIKRAVNSNKFFIITGNAIELFGQKIILENEKEINALGIFDYIANDKGMRIVGEQVYNFSKIDSPIIGFTNRACIMSEISTNLFTVQKGCGYNPNSQEEGLQKNNVYATYLLGPLLVRNPYFTDYLIKEITTYLNIPYKKPKENTAHKAYKEYLKNFEIK